MAPPVYPQLRKCPKRSGTYASCHMRMFWPNLFCYRASGLPDEIEMQKMADNDNSFIVQRLQEGGWRVIHRQADLTDVPIADFVSHREADEWVKWKSGHPKINPYAIADEVSTQPKLEIAIGPKSRCDASFPVVDAKVTLIDGAPITMSTPRHSPSVLLEPIMKVEVVGPADCIASVTSDLNLRRGQIQGQDKRGNATVINAIVPLMNMSGFVNNLRSMSRGRAFFTMRFDHYAPTPTPSSTN